MYKIAIAITALLLPMAAVAADTAATTDSQARFRSLDKDHNGYISHDEARNHRVFGYYQRADRNSDGAVDQSEFSAFEQEFPNTGQSPQK